MDHAATTPVSKDVFKAMRPYFSKKFYNPSAIYRKGKEIREDLLNFRKDVAKHLDVSSKDIVFTSGGTESDNLAILGVFEKAKEKIDTPHIIISAVEHASVKDVAKEIERRGGEVSIISVNEEGMIRPEDILNLLTSNTVLVSVILASNEVGTIEPVAKISRLVKEWKKKNNSVYPCVHTDASQAANYIEVSASSLGVDMMTLDGSKIYGPKGIGVLVLRNVDLHPVMHGGGQERGLRPGTENMSFIAGFTKALELALKDREKETERLLKLKNQLKEGIKEILPSAIINTPENSLPNILSVTFPGELAEFLAIKFDKEGIMVSTGSACGSIKDTGGTQTLKALGRPQDVESTIRFSLGRSTTNKEITRTLKALKKIMPN